MYSQPPNLNSGQGSTALRDCVREASDYHLMFYGLVRPRRNPLKAENNYLLSDAGWQRLVAAGGMNNASLSSQAEYRRHYPELTLVFRDLENLVHSEIGNNFRGPQGGSRNVHSINEFALFRERLRLQGRAAHRRRNRYWPVPKFRFR